MALSQILSKSSLLVIVVSIFLTIPAISSAPVATRGEGREILVAQSILESGDWVLPSGYGADVPSKPPLLHWLIASVSLLSGEVSNLTARLPGAALSICFLVGFLIFLKPRIGSQLAIVSVLTLATSIEWARTAITCRVDLALSALLAFGLLGVYRWSEIDFKGLPFGTALLIGLATLVKGPVAIVISVAVLSGYAIFGSRAHLKNIVLAKIKLVVLAAILPALWYWLAYKHGGERFLDKFWQENIARMSSTMEDKPHSHSIFYLLGTLYLGFIPWSLLLTIPGLLGLKNFRAKLSNVHGTFREKSIYGFSAWVALVVIVLFSIPDSKRSVYLLPAYPFIAVLISRIISSESYQISRAFIYVTRIWYTVLAFAGIVVGIIVVAGKELVAMLREASLGESGLGIARISDDTARGLYDVAESINHPGLIFVLILLLILWFLLPRIVARIEPSMPWTFFKVVLSQCFAFFFIVAILAPRVMLTLSPMNFAQSIKPLIGSASEIYTFKARLYAIDSYLKSKAFDVYEVGKVGFYLTEERNEAAFLDSISNKFEVKLLERSKEPSIRPSERLALYQVKER